MNLELIKQIFSMVPTHSSTEDRVLIWRWSILAFIITTILSFSVAYGHISGMPGFAYEYKVKEEIEKMNDDQNEKIGRIEKKLDSMENLIKSSQIRSLRSEIFNIRKNQCDAKSQNNTLPLQYFTERLSESLAAYRGMTNYAYDLPDCSEI